MLLSSVTLVTFQCDVLNKVIRDELFKKRQLPSGDDQASPEDGVRIQMCMLRGQAEGGDSVRGDSFAA